MSSTSPTILVVDDDAIARQLIKAALEPAGYTIVLADSAEAMFAKLFEAQFHLILLDVQLPGMDGLDATRRLRELSTVGLILISVRDTPAVRARGIEIGADDYIGKPFDARELRARVQQVLHRTGQLGKNADVVSLGNLEFDFAGRCFRSASGQVIKLTEGETVVLAELYKQFSNGVHRDRLQAALAGTHVAVGSSRSLDTLVSRLRSKMVNAGETHTKIISIRQFGYRLERGS